MEFAGPWCPAVAPGAVGRREPRGSQGHLRPRRGAVRPDPSPVGRRGERRIGPRGGPWARRPVGWTQRRGSSLGGCCASEVSWGPRRGPSVEPSAGALETVAPRRDGERAGALLGCLALERWSLQRSGEAGLPVGGAGGPRWP
ncbi:hypothetical protein NDU88_006017 [Pleurodeles waltl]|uniref:Uncharacterized protein n=1 Tax=Pleurodeles waltl TaxID=8319 RepID=A0AAV7MBQ1_PLEWA|nr:hypothetical protein NDU88_006017 [Pleurodeles waltl]